MIRQIRLNNYTSRRDLLQWARKVIMLEYNGLFGAR